MSSSSASEEPFLLQEKLYILEPTNLIQGKSASEDPLIFLEPKLFFGGKDDKCQVFQSSVPQAKEEPGKPKKHK